MGVTDLVKFVLFFLVAAIIFSTVLSVFLTILSFIFTLAMIVMFMSLFAFALRAVTEVSYNQNSKNSTDDMKDMSQNERLEKLKNEYINGDLSEEEFERMVDLELSGPTEEEIEFSHEFNRI